MSVISSKAKLYHQFNPFAGTLKGRGLLDLIKRLTAIPHSYGLTSAKMDEALTLFSTSLRRYNAKATLPIPAAVLARHHPVIRKYQEQGFEFAVYGLTQTDYTRLTLAEQQARMATAKAIFETAGVRVKGFRCPDLRWNEDTLIALAAGGFQYDNSQVLVCPGLGLRETRAYRRVLRYYQAESVVDRPRLPWLEGELVRIPYCLPDDNTLFDYLHLRAEAVIVRSWSAMLQQVHETGELLALGLHPERFIECRGAVETILATAHTLSPAVWFARLDEIAEWWRALAQVTFEVAEPSPGLYDLKVRLPFKGTVLARNVEVRAKVKAWDSLYQQVPGGQFRVRSQQRPFIGVSPTCSPALVDFLRQQGFLIEVSQDAPAYQLYFQQPTFDVADQRQMLTTIETSSVPLVRVGRWPDGARCALTITGVISALTLQDYLLRPFKG